MVQILIDLNRLLFRGIRIFSRSLAIVSVITAVIVIASVIIPLVGAVIVLGLAAFFIVMSIVISVNILHIFSKKSEIIYINLFGERL